MYCNLYRGLNSFEASFDLELSMLLVLSSKRDSAKQGFTFDFLSIDVCVLFCIFCLEA